ncbi:TetR family transcriptional regulator [Sphingomonas jeddahensis]|uniref:HTH-type transcriptional repressor NicS n=1 Tax=Sphingomonas jeddahensis TaxID=1915074 RepID=A0A1V2ETB3_9SPHN|nr:TetR family transcriptional regulator [Sphingomonas jeddahensis]ONF95384.1 HTH-type transcriptional repressor NicS [Sphingomonas jeddahensis]
MSGRLLQQSRAALASVDSDALADAARQPNTRPSPSGRGVLLDAARDLMIESGSSDVSLHAIARRAGVTAPLVKYYFGSKEGLLTALVESDTARSLEQLDGLLSLDVTPTQKLTLHVTGIIRTYARHPYLNGLLNRLVRESGTEASDRIKASFVEPLIHAQRRIIEAGIAAGEFRPIDPNHAYFLIVGACQYLFATRVPFGNLMNGAPSQDNFVRTYTAAAVDFVLQGLAARPGSSRSSNER